jgi:hypothetical protein
MQRTQFYKTSNISGNFPETFLETFQIQNFRKLSNPSCVSCTVIATVMTLTQSTAKHFYRFLSISFADRSINVECRRGLGECTFTFHGG